MELIEILKIKATISNSIDDIDNSSHLILPGVGSFKKVDGENKK